jgi:hypothetical protein
VVVLSAGGVFRAEREAASLGFAWLLGAILVRFAM